MQKIKVLHMVQDLKVGGLEKVLANIVLGLDSKRYAVEVWCLAAGGQVAEELQGQGIKVEILTIDNYHNPLKVLSLFRRLQKEKFHIIHTHGYFANTVGRVTAKMAGVPVILSHVHSMYWVTKIRHKIMEKLLSLVNNRIICISNIVQEFLVQSEGVDRSKTITIYNGIPDGMELEFDDRAKIRQELTIPEKGTVIATVASLNKHKGHRYIIDAFLKNSKLFPETYLLIVGEGPLRSDLEAIVKENGSQDRIVFTGERKDIYRILSAIDLFVLYPVEAEGLGISLLEAMSLKKPVFGADIGGIPEVIEHGKSGVLVQPLSSDALALALKKFLQGYEQGLSMGEKGRERFLSHFSLKGMISEIEKLYESELRQRGL